MSDETHTVADRTVVGLSWDSEDRKWSIIGDLRAPHSGMEDDANYMCADAIRQYFPHIEFDCETSCFYAYAKDRMQAIALIDAIKGFLTAHRETLPAFNEDDEFS